VLVLLLFMLEILSRQVWMKRFKRAFWDFSEQPIDMIRRVVVFGSQRTVHIGSRILCEPVLPM
jgi:hypothetical protein